MPTNDDHEQRVRAFWWEKLVPAAERLRARGIEFFPLGPDASAQSYYVPSDGAEALQRLEPSRHGAALRERWEGEGLTEMVALAEPLLVLASELKPNYESSGDVSPLIYVMF